MEPTNMEPMDTKLKDMESMDMEEWLYFLYSQLGLHQPHCEKTSLRKDSWFVLSSKLLYPSFFSL